MKRVRLLVLAMAAALPFAAQERGAIIGIISPHPIASPQEIARLELKIQAQPEDYPTRIRLLTLYRDATPPGSPSGGSQLKLARLQHILYLVEKRPADPFSASELAYVPFADRTDHELVRSAWSRAIETNPDNSQIKVNASRFLYVEHPEAGEELLRRSLESKPSDQLIAANLGFFYAADILGVVGPSGSNAKRAEAEQKRLAAQAREELDRTNNAIVLAGAGTALPNLAMRTGGATGPNPDPSAFELNSSSDGSYSPDCSTRARIARSDAVDTRISGFHERLRFAICDPAADHRGGIGHSTASFRRKRRTHDSRGQFHAGCQVDRKT